MATTISPNLPHKIAVLLDEDQYDAIRLYSCKKRISVSTLIRSLIVEFLESKGELNA